MSYLRFDDKPDGVHVFFDDVTNPGGLGTESTFNETEIAVLTRRKAHKIKFSIDFKLGPANDVVRIFINGKLRAKGTTWEDYYRFDSEQTDNGNQLFPTDQLIFPIRGYQTPANAGKGFLIDGIRLKSTNPPTGRADCRGDAWKTHTRDDGTPFQSKRACLRYLKEHARDEYHRGDRDDKHHRHYGRALR